MTFDLDTELTDAGLIHLAIVVDDEAVWPHAKRDDPGSDFDPEDVLAWLADAWPALLLEQSWPIQFQPDQEPRSLTGLLRAAEDRWDNFDNADAAKVEHESSLIDTFLYSHDMREMKHGAGLRACFILRQHRHVRIEANGTIFESVRFHDFMIKLNELADLAIKSLRERENNCPVDLITRWENRDQIDPLDAAAFLSGIQREEIEKSADLSSSLVMALSNRKLSEIANDNNSPIQAAARASGVLGPAGLADILRRIQAAPHGNTAKIGKLRRRLQPVIRDGTRPLDQGMRAAELVRTWLGLAGTQPVDLKDLSARLDIQVDEQAIPDNRLDGIAIIGPQHGPAIILNKNTRRKGARADDLQRSLRFTWAHEIGHLLLDHDEWPALVDATRQRVSRPVETRANAFATYLLLPYHAALQAWLKSHSPIGWRAVESLLNRLTGEFGLPRIVVARRLTGEVPPERRALLEAVFRQHVENFDRT